MKIDIKSGMLNRRAPCATQQTKTIVNISEKYHDIRTSLYRKPKPIYNLPGYGYGCSCVQARMEYPHYASVAVKDSMKNSPTAAIGAGNERLDMSP